jgi:hypothetical protein
MTQKTWLITGVNSGFCPTPEGLKTLIQVLKLLI